LDQKKIKKNKKKKQKEEVDLGIMKPIFENKQKENKTHSMHPNFLEKKRHIETAGK
jgi:hypothetical protein